MAARILNYLVYGSIGCSLSLGAWLLWHGRLNPWCDRAYPDICIPSPPPILTCGDIAEQTAGETFRVYLPVHRDKPLGLKKFDPHTFDLDGDGFGCEQGGGVATRSQN